MNTAPALMNVMDELQVPLQFMTSLAIGLLLGLERQRNPIAKAGLRTCALVALFGTICGLLAQVTQSTWVVTAGLLLAGAMIIAAYAGEALPEGESGTTTVIAVLLCYVLGVMVWYGRTQHAVGLAIAATVLLHFKTELHGFSDRLAPGDITSMLQFAVLSFIVLPLLPNQGYGPYQALNPHHLWLMVVLISGVSLSGYLALRLARAQRLLQHSAQSILQVGLSCGFASGPHFSNAYKAHYGHTPRDERSRRLLQLRGAALKDLDP